MTYCTILTTHFTTLPAVIAHCCRYASRAVPSLHSLGPEEGELLEEPVEEKRAVEVRHGTEQEQEQQLVAHRGDPHIVPF